MKVLQILKVSILEDYLKNTLSTFFNTTVHVKMCSTLIYFLKCRFECDVFLEQSNFDLSSIDYATKIHQRMKNITINSS